MWPLRAALGALPVFALISNTSLAQQPPQRPLPAICAMSKEDANRSPLCVRYYFTCEGRPVPVVGAGMAAGIDLKERQRLMLGAVFRLAEDGCQQFSYEEALAAMHAKMFIYEGR